MINGGVGGNFKCTEKHLNQPKQAEAAQIAVVAV